MLPALKRQEEPALTWLCSRPRRPAARGCVQNACLREGCDAGRRASERAAGEGARHTPSRRRERQRRKHNGRSSAALIFFAPLAARIGPAVFVPQQSALSALIDCFGRGQKLKWKTLQRDRMRESRAPRSRNATTNEAGDEQERVGCLLPVALFFHQAAPTRRAQRNLAVPRQQNEPPRLITYLTYQMCLYLMRSW